MFLGKEDILTRLTKTARGDLWFVPSIETYFAWSYKVVIASSEVSNNSALSSITSKEFSKCILTVYTGLRSTLSSQFTRIKVQH